MTPQTMVLEDGSRITAVHLSIMVPVEEADAIIAGAVVERIACAPRMPDLSAAGKMAPVVRTDDPRIVSCPLCKMSKQYALALERIRTAPRMVR
jgi:hypothetical protein